MIDAARPLEDVGEAALHRGVVGHVEFGEFDLDAVFGGRGQQLLGLGDSSDGAEHPMSVDGEVDGGGAADAGVGAGDDGDR